jgi:uncharacterized protein
MKRIFADKPFARFLFILCRMLCMVYIGFSIYLAIFQRRMIYYPTRGQGADLIAIASRNGLSPWYSPDQILMGWKPAHAPPPGADLLLVFHGNAGFALHRTYLVDGFQRPPGKPAFHVFIMEYPGYGARPGTPSETTLKQAGAEALSQLQRDHPGSRIFLAGESLGSGIACWLAGENPTQVAGLFLMTTFNRLTDVARHHYRILPVDLLLRDRYESTQALETYRGPVGILLAGKDNVVPARFGKHLFEAYQGPKRLWIQENRNHNTLDYGLHEPWWTEVTQFLLTQAAPPPVSL